MKKYAMLIMIVPVLLFSGCKTTDPAIQSDTNTVTVPKPTDPKTPVIDSAPTDKPADPTITAVTDEDTVVVQFDSVRITKQLFNVTKTEIQLVVEDLNSITYSKDYNRWLPYLSDEYRQNFSDPAVLEKVTASLPTKGITVKTLKDYFNYVFVPSRQNMRVDDIQFVSPTRVYVIMEIAPKSPAAIYILEKSVNGWKLVLKNK